jgi:hypothetical protein
MEIKLLTCKPFLNNTIYQTINSVHVSLLSLFASILSEVWISPAIFLLLVLLLFNLNIDLGLLYTVIHAPTVADSHWVDVHYSQI